MYEVRGTSTSVFPMTFPVDLGDFLFGGPMATEFHGLLAPAPCELCKLALSQRINAIYCVSASPCIAPRSHHCPGQRTLSVRRGRNTKPAANIHPRYNSAHQEDAPGLDRELHASRVELGRLPLMRQISSHVREDDFEVSLKILTKNKGRCSDTTDRSRPCIVACLIKIKLLETDK